MHKSKAKNFARPKGRKKRKRTRKSPKKAKTGAFWVLERVRAGEDGCKWMRKLAKNLYHLVWTRSRLPARSALDSRHRRPAPLGTRFWSGCGIAHKEQGRAGVERFFRKSENRWCYSGATSEEYHNAGTTNLCVQNYKMVHQPVVDP